MKSLFQLCLKLTFLFLISVLFSNPAISNSLENLACPDPPINDDPCITSINPPFDLTGGGSHVGTTCCARGPEVANQDGSVADWENQEPCNDLTEDAAVWYMFTPDTADDGYDIIVNGGSVTNQMTVQIYAAANPADLCTGVPIGDGVIASSCSDLSVEIRISNCDPTLTYFIKVTTSDDNCGEFDISIQSATVCNFADICEEAIDPLLTITQGSCADPLEYITVPGCLDLACPEDSDLGCMQDQGPTVWFKINIDAPEATALITQVDAPGFEAVWGIFQGTSCADMVAVPNQEVIDGVTQSFACSNSDGDNGNLFSIPILPDAIADGLMYWVSVTAIGEITDPNFDFSYNSALPCLACSGDSPIDCNNGDFSATVLIDGVLTEVENDFQFCQGMDVTVCLEFNYNTTGSGNDWLHGFVPVFGPGWDVNDDVLAGISPGGNFEFFRANGDCAPILNGYDLPNICTYIEDGVLKLCNSACDATCPCSGGMEDGDALPSGYWWNSGGGTTTCGTFGCSPASFFGWPNATNVDVEVCFDLTTKVFDTVLECEERKSLKIIVQTFSDAVTGCWDDANPCVVDPSIQGPSWEVRCSELPPALVEIDDITVCSGETLNVPIMTVDGSINDIIVEAKNSLTIYGEQDYVFENGSGIIIDELRNLTTIEAIQVYEVFSQDSTLACNGSKTVFNVTVLPPIQIDIEDKVCECLGGCTTLEVEPELTYLWSTGETTNTITICPDEVVTVDLEVTYSEGCVGFASILVDCEGTTPQCMQSDEFKIQYDFYIDENRDGVRDSIDGSIGIGSLIVDPEGAIIYNTTIGQSDLYLDEGSYTISFNADYLEGWYLTSLDSIPVTLDTSNNCVLVEFGLTNDEVFRDQYLNYQLNHRCNTDQVFYLFMNNFGNVPESGIIWAEMDELIIQDDFFDINEVDTFIMPNKIGWVYEGVLPGNGVTITPQVHIPGPPDFPVGGFLDHKIYLEINNLDGTTSIVEEQDIHREVLCSYDPNDKAVDPYHPEGYTDLEEEELTFKIRFQNTGNAPAEHIVIIDTLSEYVQVESVRYVGGSHDEFLSFSRSGERILSFNFNNIYLPDSTSDLQGSQGFLIYNIKINEDLPEGALIENTAYIYFDNNPAVVTNTTENILYDDADDDGYFSIEDCDEEDPAINPNAEEIANNDVDEDCDGEALIIDNDMDGFNSDEDCDDEDAAINPNAEEIANNDIDENCDNYVLIIDEDMDGFNSDEDCDDDDPAINPDAEEIANNGIDEDCDGEDLIILSTDDFNPFDIDIYPNPLKNNFTVELKNRKLGIKYYILDVSGQLIAQGEITDKRTLIDMSSSTDGVYMIKFADMTTGKISYHKLVKM